MLGRVLMDLRQELRDSPLPRLESEAVENGDGALRLNMAETVCKNVTELQPMEKTKLHQGESNDCEQSAMDFESNSLTARTQCQ